MFKQVTTLIMIVSVLVQTFSKGIVILGYYSQKEYISKYLCENRNTPKMNCCGKCQLRKRLSQEDRPGKTKETIRHTIDEIALIPLVVQMSPLPPLAIKKYIDLHSSLPSYAPAVVFRPPWS